MKVQFLPDTLFCLYRINKKKEGIAIKLINKRALAVLIDNGYADATKLIDIFITSAGKKSRGKTYYAKDDLAFIAWDILGENHDDKNYQKWKQEKERKD